MVDPMTALQNRWYNGLIGSLPGLDATSFQISQPCPPIIPTDEGLWAYANVIPPASLTFDRSLFADSFFGGYAAVTEQLVEPDDEDGELAKAIGEPDVQRWNAFLATLDPQPPPSQLPVTFRNWAMLAAPNVMNQGASALARMNLLAAALNVIKPYQGPNPRPADFNMQYGDVLQFVGNSAGASVSVSGRTSADVEGTWAGGDQSGVQGLWPQSGLHGRLSTLFASGEVTVEARFQHFGLWVSSPGSWYQSWLLQSAYSSTGMPVWEAAFGDNGFLRRFLASLVVVDGVQAIVTSNAAYSEPDRHAILGNAEKGLWPFYAPTGDGVTNSVAFGTGGGMTIRIGTEAGKPLVLGGVVLGVARYLGQ